MFIFGVSVVWLRGLYHVRTFQVGERGPSFTWEAVTCSMQHLLCYSPALVFLYNAAWASGTLHRLHTIRTAQAPKGEKLHVE